MPKDLAAAKEDQETRAQRLHAESMVVDALQGTASLASRCGEQYFGRLFDGGVTAISATTHRHAYPFSEALRTVAEWEVVFEKFSERVFHALRARDVRRAKEEGRLAVFLNTQDGGVIGQDLHLLVVLKRLGVQVFTLSSHNNRSFLADGAFEPSDAGLSKLGEKAVKECNRLGILIDLTHVGRRSALEAIAASEMPCIFSHSGCCGISDTWRNVTDEELRALALKGGVMCIPVLPGCLGRPSMKTVRQLGVDDYLDNVAHVVNLIGVDHVGIGTDYHPFKLEDVIVAGGTREWLAMRKNPFGVATKFGNFADDAPVDTETLERVYPTGLEDSSKMMNITRGLVRRGYSDLEIKKILGGNLLRVFEQVFGG